MSKTTEEVYRVNERKNYRIHKRPVILERGAHNGYVYGACAESDIVVSSDIGIRRDRNEDSFAIIPKNNEIIIIDGIGGHLGGEEAAELIAETCTSPHKIHVSLLNRLTDAHYNIHELSKRIGGQPGAVIGAIKIKQGLLTAYHTGDVRIYIFNQKRNLTHITKDRSQVQELIDIGEINDESGFSFHNIITSAIGIPGPMDINDMIVAITPRTQFTKYGRILRSPYQCFRSAALAPGDRWLVADDGLHEYVPHVDICQAMKKADIKDASKEFMAKAIQAGCPDNITFAIGEYIGS